MKYQNRGSWIKSDSEGEEETGEITKVSVSDKEREKKKNVLAQMIGVKEMVIDFICREDLAITTVKEFFEIFITSIKKE